jgi:hypothetical protein
MRVRDYKPQPVTFGAALAWLRQFPSEDRPAMRRLLDHVTYVSAKSMERTMVALNSRLLSQLARRGVKPNQVIYVSVHEAGSSSAALLNMLRDSGRLERLRCTFVDSNNKLGLHKATSTIGTGAIIYVDDFAGTGNQFCAVRDFVAQSIVGTFSEFLLIHTACEEAIYQLGQKNAVQPFHHRVHSKGERPLHENSSLFADDLRDRLRERALQLSGGFGLGYHKLATMVMFSRNAPNTSPAFFRGSLGQYPVRGIFPRTTDLAKPLL